MQRDFLRRVKESSGVGRGKGGIGYLPSWHRVVEVCSSLELKRNLCVICRLFVLLSVSSTTPRDFFIWQLSECIQCLPDLLQEVGRGGGGPGMQGWRPSLCQLSQVDHLTQSSTQALAMGLIFPF